MAKNSGQKLQILIQDQRKLTLQLKEGRRLVGQEDLTINRNLDTLLITTIDKILVRNNIDRLSLKSMEIRGKMRDTAVSGMILQTIKNATKL